MQHLTQIEIALYIAAALVMVYRPPKTWGGLGGFIERHLGDSVGFYILHLGIILVILSGLLPSLAGITATGNSLILAGTMALKLQKEPTNGTPPPASVPPVGPPPNPPPPTVVK